MTKRPDHASDCPKPPKTGNSDRGDATDAERMSAWTSLAWIVGRIHGKPLLLALLIASQAATGLVPWCLGRVVDSLGTHRTGNPIAMALAVLGVCSLGGVVLRRLFEHRFRTAMRRVELALRNEVWDTLQMLSLRTIEELPQGATLSKILRDTSIVAQAVQPLIRAAFAASLMGCVAIISAGAKAPLVALALAAMLPLYYWLLRRDVANVQTANHGFRLGIERLSENVSQQLAMLPFLRATAASGDVRPIVDDAMRETRRAGENLDGASVDMEFRLGFLLTGSQFAVLALCGWLAWNGTLTVGDVVAYYMLCNFALGAFIQAVGLLPNLHAVQESCHSLQELLTRPGEECDEGRLQIANVRGGVRIQNLEFRYDHHGAEILSHVSLSIGPRETVAVVGPSGSGKTTLARLLLGYDHPTAGTLEIGGHDIRNLHRDGLRRKIALVPQDVELFRGTLRDNITLLSPKVSEEQLARAIDIAGLKRVFHHHPAGLDTVVGPGGVELSGGERQRVAIARAVVRDADLIILDEMAHRLDVAARDEILQKMRAYCKTKSVLLITHQSEMLDMADRVFVLCDGNVTQVDNRTACTGFAPLVKSRKQEERYGISDAPLCS